MQECDHSQTNSLEDEEIEAFYKMLTQREEIDQTFAEAAGSEETLSVDQLVTFLQHQQREEAAGPALALSLIERYEPSETGEGLARACTLQSPGLHWAERPLGRLRPETRELQGWGRLSQPQASWAAFACPVKAGRWETTLQHRASLPPSVPPAGGFEDPSPREQRRSWKSRCFFCLLFVPILDPALRQDGTLF